MRKIKKTEINIYINERQHRLIGDLKETGINMSSMSRWAIRKLQDEPLPADDDGSSKKVRVCIYLDDSDRETLATVAAREGVSISEALRRILSAFLLAKEGVLKQLL